MIGGRVSDSSNLCRVYWGSHGCDLERGHEGHCRCSCADDPAWQGAGNVGGYPYYGPDTLFYGEDAAARGLRTDDRPAGE